jgi:glycerol-3-phosphate dehydrogenase
MAACAISNITIPAGARGADGARGSVEDRAAHHLARCASCCRIMPVCGPAWLLRLGLFLYDHIGGRKLLPATRTLDLTRDAGRQAAEAAVQAWPSNIPTAGSMMRAWSCSTRVMPPTAALTIRTRTRATGARRENGLWRHGAGYGDRRDAEIRRACWSMPPVPGSIMCFRSSPASMRCANVRLVQGSHIVVPKLFSHDRAYIFQNADGRIIFAIPYEDEFTLIGTTDIDYDGDPADVKISCRRDQLSLRRGSEYFARPVWPKTWSGPIPACARSMTTAPPRRRKRRATMCSSSICPGRCRCCRFMAARSPPIAGCRRSLEKLAPFLKGTKAGSLDGPCAAARRRFPDVRFRCARGELLRRLSVPDPALARRLAHAYGTAREDAGHREIAGRSRPPSAPTLTERECAISWP